MDTRFPLFVRTLWVIFSRSPPTPANFRPAANFALCSSVITRLAISRSPCLRNYIRVEDRSHPDHNLPSSYTHLHLPCPSLSSLLPGIYGSQDQILSPSPRE